MAHSDVVTDKEFSDFKINAEISRYLEYARSLLGLDKARFNVLDWGCGRGLSVLHLLEEGYHCFGCDVAPEVIARGSEIIARHGYDVDHHVRVIDENWKTSFPENFFHFSFSYQVLEHVQDFRSTVSEISRITAPGGYGLHIYPAHHRIVEGHLFMPFVHWLPKTWVRKMAINFFVLLGIEPRWEEVNGTRTKNKSKVYFDYSIGETFYRNALSVKSMFEENNFDTNFVSIDHPSIKENKVLETMTKFRPLREILHWGLINLKTVEILTKKL